jgi:hypothetical protein
MSTRKEKENCLESVWKVSHNLIYVSEMNDAALSFVLYELRIIYVSFLPKHPEERCSRNIPAH